MNSLIIPIVLWGGRPPTHKIRAIATTKQRNCVLTGCADGQICIWEISENSTAMQPKTMLFGHSSSVVSITPVCNGAKDTEFVVSASSNNEIFLWDITDGRCIEQTRISGSPTKLISLQLNVNGRLEPCILCIGLFAEIFVISAMTLETLATLVSRIYPDWISCCSVIPSEAETSVVGLTMSGTIKVWQMPNSLSTNLAPILEDESKQLRCQNAVQLSYSPYPTKLLLVICAFEWQLYDAGDFSLLCSVSSPKGSVISGGDFLQGCNRVVLWDQSGVFYVYALPFPAGKELSMDSVKAYAKEKVELLHCFSCKESSGLSSPPVASLTVLKNGDFLLYCGNSNGRVELWSISKNAKTAKCIDSIHLQSACGLSDYWESLVRKPTGIIDNLGKDSNISVTTSLYLEKWGQLACGREDGSIVIVPAARACKSQLVRDGPMTKKCWIPHRTLRGHLDRVTCLLYPHQESDRYSGQIFISGSADFSIILWELFTGAQLHVFNVHGGEITQLIVPPEECSSRIQQSICSVASDHSVAILSVRERKCVMLAASHTSMVTSIKWRPLEDFVLVSCSDGGLFIWQMETGHLDRYVTGVAVTEILEACDECQSNRTDNVVQGSVNLTQAIKRRNLAGFKAAAQQGLRSIIETIEDKMQDGEAEQQNINAVACSQAMLVQPIRASPTQDDDSHILFFNTEAIIGTLLQEQALRKKLSRSQKRAENGNNTNSARKAINAFIYQVKNQLLESSDQGSSAPGSPNPPRKTKEKKGASMEVDTIMNVAQLLLSCLHGWGLDPNLDNICKNKLGIFEPIVPICFGLLSREGQMALMLPTWTKPNSIAIATTESVRNGYNHILFSADLTTKLANGDALEKCSHLTHWEISSTVTTHHLIGVIAVANTMMELSNVGFMGTKTKKATEPFTEDSTSGNVSEGFCTNATESAEIKQGLALLATTHCVLLQELLNSTSYKPPKLELLARRWQDRCLEVRESAQALLLAKLRQIEPEGRRRIVEKWAKHMPDYIQQQHIDLVPNTRSDETPNSSSLASSPSEDVLDKSSVSSVELATEAPSQSMRPSAQKISYETRRRQATAVIILGVIGAEFGQEMEPSRSNSSSPLKPAQGRPDVPDGFKLSNYSLARNTCKALVYLLLHPASPRLPAHAPIRRAAIDLLGRGFTVWEPYIEVSAVLLGLLELCIDYESHKASIQSGLPLSAKADSCRSSHHALCLIATARPLTFITTIAREVARHNAAAANPQHQALLATSIIVRSRAEILRIIELLAEKMMSDVMDLLLEVVDIIIFCIDTNTLRTSNGLVDAIPALSRFHSISFDPKSKRIAVGTRQGSIYFYDLRTNKHQQIHRGRHAIATLSFSPEGKYLSAYSIQDNHLSFWMTSSSLFGMLQSQVKCVKTTRLLPAALSQRLAASPDNTRDSMKNFIKLAWVNNRMTVLLLPDGNEYKCHV